MTWTLFRSRPCHGQASKMRNGFYKRARVYISLPMRRVLRPSGPVVIVVAVIKERFHTETFLWIPRRGECFAPSLLRIKHSSKQSVPKLTFIRSSYSSFRALFNAYWWRLKISRFHVGRIYWKKQNPELSQIDPESILQYFNLHTT